jgi:hypothetical protein
LGSALGARGVKMSPTNFTAVVSVVRLGSVYRWAHWSPAEYELCRALSPSERLKVNSALCRAQFKLLDALEFLDSCGIAVDKSLPVVDVGASAKFHQRCFLWTWENAAAERGHLTSRCGDISSAVGGPIQSYFRLCPQSMFLGSFRLVDSVFRQRFR